MPLPSRLTGGIVMDLYNDGDMINLLKKARAGDREARNSVVVANMGLVWSVVKRFQNRGYDTEDLFQIGCIGLIKAIDNFDTNYDVKFSTYAVPMIIGEIKRFLRDDGIIKVSRSLKELNMKIKVLRDNIIKEEGREPGVNELAEKLGVSAADIASALDASETPESLYSVIKEGDSNPIYLIDKYIEDDRGEERDIIDKIALKQVLGRLGKRERQIIVMRFFQSKTQTQVAEKLGLSQVQISRIEKKILKNIRESIN